VHSSLDASPFPQPPKGTTSKSLARKISPFLETTSEAPVLPRCPPAFLSSTHLITQLDTELCFRPPFTPQAPNFLLPPTPPFYNLSFSECLRINSVQCSIPCQSFPPYSDFFLNRHRFFSTPSPPARAHFPPGFGGLLTRAHLLDGLGPFPLIFRPTLPS